MTDEKKIWFPAKTYGWGWGPPVCWQGWVVLIVFVALIAAAPILVPPHNNLIAYFAYVIGMTGALIFICWKKGEKPQWRWGK